MCIRDRDHVVRLPARIGERPMPPVQLVDLRTAPMVAHPTGVPWSTVLDDAVTVSYTHLTLPTSDLV